MNRLPIALLATIIVGTVGLGGTHTIQAQPPHHVSLQQQTPTSQPCPSPQPSGDGGELTIPQKSTAFAQVIPPAQPTLLGTPSAVNQYSGYHFTLDQSTTPPGAILPVLAKAIGNVESDWSQYKNNVTLRNVNGTNSCDYGLMQVNWPKASGLFTSVPSLLSTTRGNIAAGAVVMKDKWNDGVTATGANPVVNDRDPDMLLNWYYAAASYNQAPNPNWVNNPNCGRGDLAFSCADSPTTSTNYQSSRGNGVDWLNAPNGFYPYQERVLYSTQYPKDNLSTEWMVANKSLKQVTSKLDYGIRPDDALFLKGGNANYAPNLLLFRHRAAPIRLDVNAQYVWIQYDMPRKATTVSIDIIRNTTVLIQFSVKGDAGWHSEARYVPFPLMNGDFYRIRAVIGNPSTIATYYVGQYTQQFQIQPLTTAGAPIQRNTYFPQVGNNGDTNAPQPRALLLNGNFGIPLPEEPHLPDYWEIQNIAGPNIDSSTLMRRTLVDGERHLGIYAAPNARAEIRQRVTPSILGPHTLQFRLFAGGMLGTTNTRLIVRARPIEGTTWQTLGLYDRTFNNIDTTFNLNVNVQEPIVLSFLALFDATDTSSFFSLGNVMLTSGSTTSAAANRSSTVASSNAYPAPATATPPSYPPPNTTPTATATAVPTATPSATPTATATAVPTAPPASPGTILDTFNRANGALGPAWLGDIGGYVINSNAMKTLGGGAIYYNQTFGVHQTASVTLGAINANASEIDLLLKGQGTGQCNVLEAWYIPATHTVRVATCANNQWTEHGAPINVTFQPGDRFRVDAFDEGTVNIYKNEVLAGRVEVRDWPYTGMGGRIGIWTIDATNTRFDDFGGGSL